MGQKVNPIGFRTGPTLIKSWASVFYADHKNTSLFILEDSKIRKLIEKTDNNGNIGEVKIKRASEKSIVIDIYAKKPGIVIGKEGADINKLKLDIAKFAMGEDIYINVHEVRKPELDSILIAKSIAMQIERRGSYKRAMKKAIETAMRSGALGIKVSCSGRLNGAEIARTESYKEGKVPLHTLSADIGYALHEAKTTYGIIGVKVWIYKNIKKHRVTRYR